MFSNDLNTLNMLIASVPESLALLIFGVCLTGATIGLRWLLKRHDESVSGKADSKR